jgi:hypothetical protein
MSGAGACRRRHALGGATAWWSRWSRHSSGFRPLTEPCQHRGATLAVPPKRSKIRPKSNRNGARCSGIKGGSEVVFQRQRFRACLSAAYDTVRVIGGRLKAPDLVYPGVSVPYCSGGAAPIRGYCELFLSSHQIGQGAGIPPKLAGRFPGELAERTVEGAQ